MDFVFVLALVLAIVLLQVVQVLRVLLGTPIVPTHSRPAPGLTPPAAWADLFAGAREELRALEFAEPVWFLQQGEPAQPPRALAIALHPDGHAALLSAPARVDAPHLAGAMMLARDPAGRIYTTYRHDGTVGYFENADYRPASVDVPSLADLFRQHRARCPERLAPIHSAEDASALNDSLADRALAPLLASGRAEQRARGCYLGYRAAVALLWRVLRQGRPPAIANALPPARLQHFADLAARSARTTPPADRQIILFLATVLLSLLLGGMVFGVEVAVILLVIILIHEAGHLAAMWAFGYRHLQLLALPLVGGVAIGQEARPDASHRAWMALAGPVPGVLIGLAMFLLAPSIPLPPDWYYTAATLFVVINLINLAPFAPLDGWQVLRALLPGGYLALSAWLLAIGGVLGALLSIRFGLVVLALILGLQLLTVPGLLQQARWVRQLHRAGMPDARLDRSVRLLTVLQRLDALAGTTATVQPRLSIAEAALEAQDLRPMRTGQRLLVGGTLLAMVGLPLLLLIGLMRLSNPALTNAPSLPDFEDGLRQQRDALAPLDLAQLLARHDAQAAGQPVPAGVSEAALQAAEQRLGVALPPDLRAFYARRDGLEALGLPPLAELDWQPGPAEVWSAELAYQDPETVAEAGGDTGQLWFRSLEQGRLEPAAGDRRHLGASGLSMLLIDPDPSSTGPYFTIALQSARSIETLLRDRLAHEGLQHQAQALLDARTRLAAVELRRLDVPEILERGDFRRRVPWYVRWQLPAAPPAPAIDWPALDARLPAPLPPDLREALELGGNLAGLQIDATAIGPTTLGTGRFVGRYRDPYCFADDASDCIVAEMQVGDVEGCIAVLGRPPTTLWCPQRSTYPYLGADGKAYADFRSLLAWHAGAVTQHFPD